MYSVISVFILLVLKIFCLKGETCYDFESKGYTTPKGDINLLQGSDLVINCTLYNVKPTETSRNLFWINNKTKKLYNGTILTNATAQLLIRNVSREDSAPYHCKLNNDSNVCANLVNVGFPAPKIEKIKCISKDWDNMNCSWKYEKNPVKIAWNLAYIRNGKKITSGPTNIMNISENHNAYLIVTNLNAATCLKIQLNGSNALGNSSSDFTLTVDRHVILVKPSLSIRYHYAHRKVNILGSIKSFNILKTVCRLKYNCNRPSCSKDQSEEFYIAAKANGNPENCCDNTNCPSNRLLHYYKFDRTIKQLFLPANYSVKVKCRINSTEDPDYWSEEAELTFETNSTVPEFGPVLNVGSYMQSIRDDVRNITIYWKSIPEYFANGQNLFYVLRYDDKTINSSLPSQTINHLRKNSSYTITIKTCNEVGCAPNQSSLIIPEVKPEFQRFNVHAVRYFKKENKYEISWRNKTTSYSRQFAVFYCIRDYSQKDSEKCNEQGIDKRDLVSETNEVNLTLGSSPDSLRFAVAPVNGSDSYGLTWANCIKPSNESTQVTDISLSGSGPTWINIHWNVLDGCVFKNTIGYKIIYQAENENAGNKKIIEDEFTTSVNLTGLKTDTKYKISLFIIDDSSSERAGPSTQYETTSEFINQPAATSSYLIVIAILGSLFGFGILSGTAIYLVRKLKLKIKELKNIQVPIGLSQESNSCDTLSNPPPIYDLLPEKVELPLITSITPSPPCEKLTNGSHSSGFGSDCPESTTSSPAMSFNWNHPTSDVNNPKITSLDAVFDYPPVDPIVNYSQVGSFPVPSMQVLDVSALKELQMEPASNDEFVKYAKLDILPSDHVSMQHNIGIMHPDDTPLAKGYTSITASDLMQPYVKLALNESSVVNDKAKNIPNNIPIYLSHILQEDKTQNESVLLPSAPILEPLTSSVGPGYVTCRSLTGPVDDLYVCLQDEIDPDDNEVFHENDDDEYDKISLPEYFETSSNHSDEVNG